MVGGAYVEGWGLYAERLADEMGLYRNEAERFGMLDAQAWRAARLVVDTGLHALRWPRQRSIDFLDGRPVRDRRGHRDRSLHLLARSGADLQDRPARDRAAARRDGRPRRRRASTCGRSTTPLLGHGSLPLATLSPRAPELGAEPGLIAGSVGPGGPAKDVTPRDPFPTSERDLARIVTGRARFGQQPRLDVPNACLTGTRAALGTLVTPSVCRASRAFDAGTRRDSHELGREPTESR